MPAMTVPQEKSTHYSGRILQITSRDKWWKDRKYFPQSVVALSLERDKREELPEGAHTDTGQDFRKQFSAFLRSKNWEDKEIQRILADQEEFFHEYGYRVTNDKSVTRKHEPLSSQPEKSWVKQVRPEASKPLALPEEVPALWKQDKQPSDTPPDFIKRHYAKWLRPDGWGLTRAWLRQNDPHLYRALYNWMKSNNLPDDCPLPTKTIANDAKLSWLETTTSSSAGPLEPEELHRLGAAMKYRQQRHTKQK